jgi:hypothetical protein
LHERLFDLEERLPRQKRENHMLEFARRGAESRLRELVDELRMLTAAFPHLRDSFDADELPINFILRRGRDKAEAQPAKRRRRVTWTAAQRKAVSARMRRYWAKRRRAEK